MTQDPWKTFFEKARPHRWILLIILVAFVAYFNSLFNGFVYDDARFIIDSDVIKNVNNIPRIFSENVCGLMGRSSNYYRPLVPLMYMLTYHIFGLSPWAFHCVNILFHVGTCIVVYLIIDLLLHEPSQRKRNDFTSPAFIAALLFATHPIHTEAVAWISGIMDLSCGFFSLLTFYLFMRTNKGVIICASYFFSLVSFFLATLCKEPAVFLPLILFLYAFLITTERKKPLLNAMIKCIPYVFVIAVYLSLRLYALKGLAPEKNPKELSFYEGVINIFFIFPKYVANLILPINLNVNYFLKPISSVLSFNGVLSVLLTIVFLSCMFIALKRNKVAFLGLVFIVITLLPALYLPALAQRVESAITDRYLYLPSLGFILVIAALLTEAEKVLRGQSKKILTILFSVIIVFYLTMTVVRNTVWKNNLTLWSDALRKSPESVWAHTNLGYALLNAGKTEEGKQQLRIAQKLDPSIHDINLMIATGIKYSKNGLWKEAIFEFQEALRFEPDSWVAHYNLGLAYHDKGWIIQAIEQYLITLKLQPDYADAHNNLGIAYGETGSIDKAIEHFQSAIRLKPLDRDTHYNLAKAYELKGLKDKADEERHIARNLEQ